MSETVSLWAAGKAGNELEKGRQRHSKKGVNFFLLSAQSSIYLQWELTLQCEHSAHGFRLQFVHFPQTLSVASAESGLGSELSKPAGVRKRGRLPGPSLKGIILVGSAFLITGCCWLIISLAETMGGLTLSSDRDFLPPLPPPPPSSPSSEMGHG